MPPTDRSCAILALGRYISPIDAETLIAALARLFDLDWMLLLAADPDWDAAQPRATAEALGVAERVLVTTAPDWARACLLACAVELPELDDAATEAFAHGVPILALAHASGDRIRPENGVVCPPGDREQLSKAIRRLIFDTGLRADMTAAARASA